MVCSCGDHIFYNNKYVPLLLPVNLTSHFWQKKWIMMDSQEPVTHMFAELSSLEDLTIPLKRSSRLRYTSLSVSRRYIALGSNSGGVYVFSRESLKHLQVVFGDVEPSPVTVVALSPNDLNVALAVSSGQVVVMELNIEKRSRSERLRQTADHLGAVVTSMIWDSTSTRLFVADTQGKVTLVHVPASKAKTFFTQPSETIVRLGSAVCQLDWWDNKLLVSSLTASYLLNTAKHKFSQIGKKPREGEFGACFFAEPSSNYPVIYCARPGSRIWEVDFDGNVLHTHQLKHLLSIRPSPTIYPGVDFNAALNMSSSGPLSVNFQRLFRIGEFILAWSVSGLHILDPVNVRVVHWVNAVEGVVNITVLRNDVYLLLSTQKVRRLVFLPVFQLCSALVSRHRCVLAAKLLLFLEQSATHPTFLKRFKRDLLPLLIGYLTDQNELQLKEKVQAMLEDVSESSVDSLQEGTNDTYPYSLYPGQISGIVVVNDGVSIIDKNTTTETKENMTDQLSPVQTPSANELLSGLDAVSEPHYLHSTHCDKEEHDSSHAECVNGIKNEEIPELTQIEEKKNVEMPRNQFTSDCDSFDTFSTDVKAGETCILAEQILLPDGLAGISSASMSMVENAIEFATANGIDNSDEIHDTNMLPNQDTITTDMHVQTAVMTTPDTYESSGGAVENTSGKEEFRLNNFIDCNMNILTDEAMLQKTSSLPLFSIDVHADTSQVWASDRRSSVEMSDQGQLNDGLLKMCRTGSDADLVEHLTKKKKRHHVNDVEFPLTADGFKRSLSTGALKQKKKKEVRRELSSDSASERAQNENLYVQIETDPETVSIATVDSIEEEGSNFDEHLDESLLVTIVSDSHSTLECLATDRSANQLGKDDLLKHLNILQTVSPDRSELESSPQVNRKGGGMVPGDASLTIASPSGDNLQKVLDAGNFTTDALSASDHMTHLPAETVDPESDDSSYDESILSSNPTGLITTFAAEVKDPIIGSTTDAEELSHSDGSLAGSYEKSQTSLMGSDSDVIQISVMESDSDAILTSVMGGDNEVIPTLIQRLSALGVPTSPTSINEVSRDVLDSSSMRGLLTGASRLKNIQSVKDKVSFKISSTTRSLIKRVKDKSLLVSRSPTSSPPSAPMLPHHQISQSELSVESKSQEAANEKHMPVKGPQPLESPVKVDLTSLLKKTEEAETELKDPFVLLNKMKLKQTLNSWAKHLNQTLFQLHEQLNEVKRNQERELASRITDFESESKGDINHVINTQQNTSGKETESVAKDNDLPELNVGEKKHLSEEEHNIETSLNVVSQAPTQVKVSCHSDSSETATVTIASKDDNSNLESSDILNESGISSTDPVDWSQICHTRDPFQLTPQQHLSLSALATHCFECGYFGSVLEIFPSPTNKSPAGQPLIVSTKYRHLASLPSLASWDEEEAHMQLHDGKVYRKVFQGKTLDSSVHEIDPAGKKKSQAIFSSIPSTDVENNSSEIKGVKDKGCCENVSGDLHLSVEFTRTDLNPKSNSGIEEVSAEQLEIQAKLKEVKKDEERAQFLLLHYHLIPHWRIRRLIFDTLQEKNCFKTWCALVTCCQALGAGDIVWLKISEKDVNGAFDYLRSGILPNKAAFLGHIASLFALTPLRTVDFLVEVRRQVNIRDLLYLCHLHHSSSKLSMQVVMKYLAQLLASTTATTTTRSTVLQHLCSSKEGRMTVLECLLNLKSASFSSPEQKGNLDNLKLSADIISDGLNIVLSLVKDPEVSDFLPLCWVHRYWPGYLKLLVQTNQWKKALQTEVELDDLNLLNGTKSYGFTPRNLDEWRFLLLLYKHKQMKHLPSFKSFGTDAEEIQGTALLGNREMSLVPDFMPDFSPRTSENGSPLLPEQIKEGQENSDSVILDNNANLLHSQLSAKSLEVKYAAEVLESQSGVLAECKRLPKSHVSSSNQMRTTPCMADEHLNYKLKSHCKQTDLPEQTLQSQDLLKMNDEINSLSSTNKMESERQCLTTAFVEPVESQQWTLNSNQNLTEAIVLQHPDLQTTTLFHQSTAPDLSNKSQTLSVESQKGIDFFSLNDPDHQGLSWTALGVLVAVHVGPKAAISLIQECFKDKDGQKIGASCIGEEFYRKCMQLSAIRYQQRLIIHNMLEKIDSYLWAKKPNCLSPQLLYAVVQEKAACGDNIDGQSYQHLFRRLSSTHVQQTQLAEDPDCHWGIKTDLNRMCEVCTLPVTEPVSLSEPGIYIFICGHMFHKSCCPDQVCPLC